jgi:hypothetical protein
LLLFVDGGFDADADMVDPDEAPTRADDEASIDEDIAAAVDKPSPGRDSSSSADGFPEGGP